MHIKKKKDHHLMITSFILLGSISYQFLIYKTYNVNNVSLVKDLKIFYSVVRISYFMSIQDSRSEKLVDMYQKINDKSLDRKKTS